MKLIRDIIMDRRAAQKPHRYDRPIASDAEIQPARDEPSETVAPLASELDKRNTSTGRLRAEAAHDQYPSPVGSHSASDGKGRADDHAGSVDSIGKDDDLTEVDALHEKIGNEDSYDLEEDFEEEASEDEGPSEGWENDFDDKEFMRRLNADSSKSFEDMPDPFEKLSSIRTEESLLPRSPSPLKAFRSPSVRVERVSERPTPDPILSPNPAIEDLVPLADVTELSPLGLAAPATSHGSGRSGRVKTRLLGFSADSFEQTDPFANAEAITGKRFPVGWLVVMSELGRGSSYALYDGVAKIGRGTDQTVSLNFGDNSISRENHASIAYDAENNKFFIGQSGKSNLVRLNRKPLLSTEELHTKDLIRLGETTLRFIAFCEGDFSWDIPEEKAVQHA